MFISSPNTPLKRYFLNCIQGYRCTCILIVFKAIDESDEENEDGEIEMKIDFNLKVTDIEDTISDGEMEQKKLDKLKYVR